MPGKEYSSDQRAKALGGERRRAVGYSKVGTQNTLNANKRKEGATSHAKTQDGREGWKKKEESRDPDAK